MLASPSRMAAFLVLLVALACFVHTGAGISCFNRLGVVASTDGTTVTSCTGCGGYTDYNGRQFADCADSANYCFIPYSKSCIYCTSDFCNSLTGSTISCYSRSTAATTSNGAESVCVKGITGCYTITSTGVAGCGSCGTTSDCVGCSTNLCNSGLTTTTTTTTTTTPTTQPPSGVSSSSNISCYFSTGSATKSSISCSTTCYSYSFLSGSEMKFFNGCGNCSSISYPNCRSCNSTLCNSGSAAGASWVVAAAALLMTALSVL